MTESPESIATYDVVLLVEQPLSEQDISQVLSLHEEIEEHVRYFVLMPVTDAAAQVESAMGSLAGGEMLATPVMAIDPAEVVEVQKELLESARADVGACAEQINARGADATPEVVTIDPIEALAAKVAQVGADEAIILTRPHVISGFFHLDWTSRARRKLGVPVLHLLERETFDEQAGQGEGITGL